MNTESEVSKILLNASDRERELERILDGTTMQVERLRNQIKDLKEQHANQYSLTQQFKIKYETQYNQNAYAYRLQSVISTLFEEAFGRNLPDEVDSQGVKEMAKRIVQLIRNDANEDVWNPIREFDVSATYTLNVYGRITARTEEEAQELFNENSDLEFELRGAGALKDFEAYPAELDDVQIL
jgi:uncharacterized protein with ATP-grasp and redox domains